MAMVYCQRQVSRYVGGEFSFTTVLVQKRLAVLAYQFVNGKLDNENEW
jgi:hypothetical protein